MDEIDYRQVYCRSLAAHQYRPRRSIPLSAVRHCEECDCVIPPARVAAQEDAVCCVTCQASREALCG